MPLPTITYTIENFVHLMRRLVDEENTQEFIRLVLTGEFEGKQVVVDALRSRIYDVDGNLSDDDDPPNYPYATSRDYDSFLGISYDVCVEDRSLIFNIIPKFEDTLSTDLAITFEVPRGEVRSGSITPLIIHSFQPHRILMKLAFTSFPTLASPSGE